jgi:hypothetical protein
MILFGHSKHTTPPLIPRYCLDLFHEEEREAVKTALTK